MQSKKMSLMDQVVRDRNQSQNSLYLDGAQLVECLPSMHQALSSPVLYKPIMEAYAAKVIRSSRSLSITQQVKYKPGISRSCLKKNKVKKQIT